MYIFTCINPIFTMYEVLGIEVTLANGTNRFFDLTNLSGTERVLNIFMQYRKLQEEGFGGQWKEEQLAPRTIEECAKVFKKYCHTIMAPEVNSAIWQGIHKFSETMPNEEEPEFVECKGSYHFIYRHPTEPRLCGIKAEKAWQTLCDSQFQIDFGPNEPDITNRDSHIHVLNLKDVLTNLDRYGIENTFRYLSYFRIIRSILDDRSFQTTNGCLVKTGKILQHLVNAEKIGQNNLSILAGYVQDALRVGVASIESVQVTDDVGKIYRMGGNFTSCMRSLGWDDKSTGKNSYQIYHDLGAQIAYIVVPENNNMRLTARAILWDKVALIKNNEVVREVKLMDTIYRDGADEQATMVKWARQNGYAYKKTECSYACSSFTYGPDRSNEDFNLKDFDDARVYRVVDGVWERGMYHRVPWVDLFASIQRYTNYAGYTNYGGSYLHSQSGKGGFLTDIIKCQFCDTELTSADEEENWRERDGRWTCPSCYDTEWVICENEDCCEEGPAADFEQIEEHWYCPSCTEHLFVNCDACGERLGHDDDFTYWDNNGTPFCEECYHDRYSYCGRCDEETYIDYLVFIDDQVGYVCRWCAEEHYRQCDDCGNMVDRDEVESCYMTANHEGKIYTRTDNLCESCREEINTQECPECGDLWDNMHPKSVDLGKPMCRDCFHEQFYKCEFADCWCEREEAQRNMSCEECHKAMHDMSE